jgi:predicted transcriptional regulator of viral defense system
MTYKEKVKIRNRIAKVPTLAGRVREAAIILTDFSADDIEDLMPAGACMIRIRETIRDFLKYGEVVRTAPGRYRYIGKEKKRTYIDIIWHLVRSHRIFDAQEMERLSGAALSTVKEYLWCLKKLGYLRRSGHGAWQLISDPGPDAPVNAAKCSRLKRIRKQKPEGRSQNADQA